MPEAQPDPVTVIDEMINSVLARPPMHGADTIQGLEILIRTLLGLRDVWAPQPEVRVPWKRVYGEWIAQFFGDTSPNNAAAFHRLALRFKWKPGETYREHEDTWPVILEFYKELVRREREAAVVSEKSESP